MRSGGGIERTIRNEQTFKEMDTDKRRGIACSHKEMGKTSLG